MPFRIAKILFLILSLTACGSMEVERQDIFLLESSDLSADLYMLRDAKSNMYGESTLGRNTQTERDLRFVGKGFFKDSSSNCYIGLLDLRSSKFTGIRLWSDSDKSRFKDILKVQSRRVKPQSNMGYVKLCPVVSEGPKYSVKIILFPVFAPTDKKDKLVPYILSSNKLEATINQDKELKTLFVRWSGSIAQMEKELGIWIDKPVTKWEGLIIGKVFGNPQEIKTDNWPEGIKNYWAN